MRRSYGSFPRIPEFQSAVLSPFLDRYGWRAAVHAYSGWHATLREIGVRAGRKPSGSDPNFPYAALLDRIGCPARCAAVTDHFPRIPEFQSAALSPRLLVRLASGADLTFATHLVARLSSECQIQSSTRFNILLVVLLILPFAKRPAEPGRECSNRTTRCFPTLLSPCRIRYAVSD
jgi:hypothetical protein